jgi:hypothetical protein
MPERLSQKDLDALDRLTDKCVEDRTLGFLLTEKTYLKTFFSREMLAEQLQKEFRLDIEEALQRLYTQTSKEIDSVSRGVAFQEYANEFSFDAVQQQVNARLERCVADFARDLGSVIRARWATRLENLAVKDEEQTDPPVAGLRLFLWL